MGAVIRLGVVMCGGLGGKYRSVMGARYNGCGAAFSSGDV